MGDRRLRLARRFYPNFLEKAREAAADRDPRSSRPWLYRLRRELSRAWPEVCARLRSPGVDDDVQFLVTAVGRAGIPRFTQVAVNRAWRSGDKMLALSAATDSDDPSFDAMFLRALGDEDRWVRGMGAQGLQWSAATGRRALQLRDALLDVATGDPDDLVKAMALQALWSFPTGDLERVFPLTTRDDDVGKRARALVQEWRANDAPPDEDVR